MRSADEKERGLFVGTARRILRWLCARFDMFLLIAILVVANLAGRFVSPEDVDYRFVQWGWPFSCVVLSDAYRDMPPPCVVRIAPLIANVILGLGVLRLGRRSFLALRRRAGLTLSYLLGVCALFAVLCGVIARTTAARRTHLRIQEELQRRGNDVRISDRAAESWWLAALMLPNCVARVELHNDLTESLQILQQVDGLTELRIGSDNLAPEHFAQISQLRDLRKLWLYGGDSSMPRGIGQLSGLPELKLLDLGLSEIDEQAIDEVGALPVEVLHLECPVGNDAICTAISRMPRLEALTIEDASDVTDEGARSLAKCAGLRTLSLPFSQLTDEGISALMPLRSLEELDIGFTKITDACVADLHQLRKLRKLGLRGTAVSDACIVSLNAVTRLEELDVYNTAIGFIGLQELQLKHLRLLDADLSDEEYFLLYDAQGILPMGAITWNYYVPGRVSWRIW